MTDGPVVVHAAQETGEGPALDTGDQHPFGGDDHPMHDWDGETRSGVREWVEGVRDEIHAARLAAAAAAVQDIEVRLAAGAPVGMAEREAANAEYRAAIAEHEHAEGQLRTLQNRTPASYDQNLSGPVHPDDPGGWRWNEAKRIERIEHANAEATRLASAVPSAPMVLDTAGDAEAAAAAYAEVADTIQEG